MADSPDSIQAILRGRRSAGFVGRGGQLAVFRENLALPAAEKAYIFNVYGEGGVGKSTLLEQWRRIARAAGAAEALVDERVFSAPEAMSALLEQLGQPREIKEFRSRYASFRKNRERLERDPQAPRELWSQIVRTGVKAGLHASKAIPGAAPVVDLIDGESAADAVDRVRQFLTTKVRDSREVRLMLYPTEELGPLFATTLRGIAASRPVVLFFDTFEQTGVLLEDWLVDLMSGTHGDLPATITVVVAGRLPLDLNRWAELFALIAPAPLAVFTDVEARQLLAAHEVTDDRTVDAIVSLSGGLPLLVDMLAKNRPGGADEVGDPADTAVERFLKWEPDESRRQAALAGALPRRIDEDLLRAALGHDDVADLFTWLVHQAFVRGDRYHDVVRSPMLRQQRQRSPQRWREAHGRLAEAYRGRRDLNGPARRWEATDWRADHFEAVYHALCAHELTVDAALGDAPDIVHAGISVARQWAETIMEAGRDTDDAAAGEVGSALFEAATRGEANAIGLLTYLIDLGRHDAAGRARLLVERAHARYLADLDALAVEDCDRALRDDPSLGRAYAVRAAAHSFLGRSDEALSDFARALELDQHNTWAMIRRGETYRVMGRYDEALRDFDRAIELDRAGDAWTLGSRGQTLRAMNRYDEAIKDLDRAIELDDSLPWLFGERGLVRQLLRRFDEAIEDLNRAVELDGDYTSAIAQRGDVHREEERYDLAVADFTRAIDKDDEYAWALAHRGESHRRMNRFEEAVADLSRAVELDGAYEWALAHRGEAYRLLERYEESLRDLDRAIELDDEFQWAIAERGELRCAMGDRDRGIADFTRAIELDDAYAWALARRGEAHRQMGQFDQALSDLDRSIELDDTFGPAFASRGEAYRQSGRHERAVGDFDRAVDLSGADAWALGSRGQAHHALGNLDEALRDLDRAIELDAAMAWALGERGDVHRRLANYDRALDDLTRAIELDPYPEYFVLRALTRRGLGQAEEAEADLGRARELDPSIDWTVTDGRVVFG